MDASRRVVMIDRCRSDPGEEGGRHQILLRKDVKPFNVEYVRVQYMEL
jgi:hypothetical protein